jgi:lipoprotein-anchoring transpeptidase ErfK/SrfK
VRFYIKNLALKALVKAKRALEEKDLSKARGFAMQATKLDPSLEDGWLVLASVSNPKDSLTYLKKALEINPKSRKARAGIHWANRELRAPTKVKKKPNKRTQSDTAAGDQRFSWEFSLFASVFFVGLLVLCFVSMPSFSVNADSQKSTRPEGALLKPTLTPTVTPIPTATPTPLPEPTALPTADTYYTSYTYHSWDIPDEITGGSTFWIEIDLTNQMLYAYRGNQLISGFLVSTGTSSHKTVTGTYKIYAKYPAYTMIGPGYHLEDVPFTMFFYKGYAIHGTFWHSNFGTPMSHGCVNMATDEAAWVYDNAPVGTYVFVHY